MALICVHHICTMVSHIYAPCFATLALVESVGGLICRIQHFILQLRPLFPVPCLDIYMGTLIYYRLIEAGSTSVYLHFSDPPEIQIPCGQD